MPTAIRMMRDAMGDEAVILSTEQGKGKRGVTVTAALDASEEPIFPLSPPLPERPANGAATDSIRYELQNVLRFHNLPEHFVSKIFQKASPRELASIQTLHQISSRKNSQSFIRLVLEKTVGSFFDFKSLSFEQEDQRIMLAGPPGIGKTLTVAKIATRMAMEKKPVRVCTTDNKRAGGIEQLQAFTSLLNIDLEVANSREELAAFTRSLPRGMHALIDTAGCNPFDREEMKELKQLATVHGIEPVLVLPAGGDSLESIDIVEAFSDIPARRLLITRADTARRFGGVLAAAAARKLSFCNVGSSSSIIDSVQALDGALLTQMLLRYQLQPQ